MGKAYRFLERLADRAELETEPMPAQPIVEIAGDRRVLVENHGGVRAYSTERILVNVKYGAVCVCGCGLELIRMTKEQLVIRGRIDSVSLQRRNVP
ncbi:MAG: YabP/YqfC family sporulation protein [Faecousia sp.]